MDADDEQSYSIMLLGDSSTGKTCLLIRFKDNTFLNNNFISTVGIDYRNKTVTVDGVNVKLQIWDTAGQERFRSVTHAYYRDADALMLVFDVTNRRSYENVRSWLCEVREYANANVSVLLVGNKCDLAAKRMVTQREAKKLADENNCVDYIETSAKTGDQVNDAFMTVTRSLMKQSGKKNDTKKDRVVLDQADAAKSWWSCCGRT